MTERFKIDQNEFLKSTTIGYYNRLYIGYSRPGNPDFLNTLKNTFNTEKASSLNAAKDMVVNILLDDIPLILKDNDLINCLCICVPRSKAQNVLTKSQLMFKEAVKTAAVQIPGITNGTDCIIRTINTMTTHLKRATIEGRISIKNDGSEPYPGITKDTCIIDRDMIRNQNALLIDDIYTKSINIDEDCIQALYDEGARKVIFYAIGFTRGN